MSLILDPVSKRLTLEAIEQQMLSQAKQLRRKDLDHSATQCIRGYMDCLDWLKKRIEGEHDRHDPE